MTPHMIQCRFCGSYVQEFTDGLCITCAGTLQKMKEEDDAMRLLPWALLAFVLVMVLSKACYG